MKKLSAYNAQNEQAVEAMMGKAMCAYANWKRATERPEGFFFKNLSESEQEKAKVAFQSEYEATVRCVEMLVKESIYGVQNIIVENCKETFGI